MNFCDELMAINTTEWGYFFVNLEWGCEYLTSNRIVVVGLIFKMSHTFGFKCCS